MPHGRIIRPMSNPTSNTFSDFPPEEFTILAFCESCGHQGVVGRAAFPKKQIVQDLPGRLRCSTCDDRDCSNRIACTGAGGYRYG